MLRYGGGNVLCFTSGLTSVIFLGLTHITKELEPISPHFVTGAQRATALLALEYVRASLSFSSSSSLAVLALGLRRQG